MNKIIKSAYTKELILNISEDSFKHNDNYYDGYTIVTTKQTIRLGITNDQSCCENWGYFMSEDDISEFITSELLNIQITDTQLKTHSDFDEKNYEGNVMFVNIITSNGLLQFVAYNEHNGYYGHTAIVISEQLTISETL